MDICIWLISIFVLYIITSLFLFFGTYFLSSNLERIKSPPNNLPTISVLIAARNEEKRLPGCLDALLNSDYPREKFELIIIDDRSKDRTLEIVQNYSRKYTNIKVVVITKRIPNMSGKASSICQGIEHSRGEIILITDADCIVQEQWLKKMVECFESGIGLVGGFTLLSPARSVNNIKIKNSLLAKVQTLDWMYLLTVGAGAAGWGVPVSILGNNFGFRRKVYDEVGGYLAIGFSIIEDFALMHKIKQSTRWKVRISLDSQTSVFSFPPTSWREFIDQRRRWAAGGKEVGFFAKYLMILAFLCHLAILLAGLSSWKMLVVGLVCKLAVDFALLWRSSRALKFFKILRVFPLFELYYFAYSFLFAPTVAFPATVHWKGVHYRWGLKGKIKKIDEL